LKRGVRPEALPAAEDVKKLERRLKADEKQVEKVIKKRSSDEQK
jgi:DNA-damage-inducible protein D